MEPGYLPDPSNSSLEENLLAQRLWGDLFPGMWIPTYQKGMASNENEKRLLTCEFHEKPGTGL